MNEAKIKIVVAGGYGRAGTAILEQLATNANYYFYIGGRNPDKAQKLARELKQKFPGSDWTGGRLDLFDKSSLKGKLESARIFIVAAPLPTEAIQSCAEAVLEVPNCHYLDLSPQKEKYWQLEKYNDRIEKSGRTFLHGCGFDPGLPVVLLQLLLEHTRPTAIEIRAKYRDANIPAGGAEDILQYDQGASLLKNGEWRKAGWLSIRRINFGPSLGKSFAMPITNLAIQDRQWPATLQSFVFYHGGINAVSDAFLLLWKGVLRLILTRQTGVNLFQKAIKKYTPKPFGGVIQAIADNGVTGSIDIFHDKLYSATAAPVAAAVNQLLSPKGGNAGLHSMATGLDISALLQQLKAMGMTITISKNLQKVIYA